MTITMSPGTASCSLSSSNTVASNVGTRGSRSGDAGAGSQVLVIPLVSLAARLRNLGARADGQATAGSQ